MITITIFFKNDPSVGLFSESYTMQIPDFRENWTGIEEMLHEYVEGKRQEIRELYNEFQEDSDCRVMFQWEEEDLMPIEEDTFEEMEKDECNIQSFEERIGDWDESISTPSYGYELCSDGLYRKTI